MIKDYILNYIASSLSKLITSIESLAKAIVIIGHKVTLLQSRVSDLEEANTTLSKRRRQKRSRLQDRGVLDRDNAQALLVKRGLVEVEGCDEVIEGGSPKRQRTGVRLCGVCRQPGHNVRTYAEAEDVDFSEDSN